MLIQLYPRLKRAILAAVDVQNEAIAAREQACRELGEATVFQNLPTVAYTGFLLKDLVGRFDSTADASVISWL